MLPYFSEGWGNPSSTYRFGFRLRTVIEKAREQVAGLIGAEPPEILFTSCATESNNTAIHAALRAHPSKRHVITSVVEHSSVLTHCQALEEEGVCASSGSACLADSDEPSPVVKAMKPDTGASRQMIGFSLGLENTLEEIPIALTTVRRGIALLRD